MKRISKFFVGLSLCVALLFGGQQKAHAQFVVTDPGSLIQMILDYLQEADMEGWWDALSGGISQLGASVEQIENLRDKLSELQNMVTWVGTALQVANELKSLVDITMAFTYSYDRLRTIAHFLQVNDQGFNIAIAAANCLADYNEIFDDFLKSAKDLFSQIKSLSKEGALDFLSSVTKLAEDFYNDFSVLTSHFEMKMMSLYYKWSRIETSLANKSFLSVTIY